MRQVLFRQLTLYPSVANEKVTIRCEEEIQYIFVYDMNGTRVVHTQNNEISVQNLPDGMYVAVVKTKSGSLKSARFIVRK